MRGTPAQPTAGATPVVIASVGLFAGLAWLLYASVGAVGEPRGVPVRLEPVAIGPAAIATLLAGDAVLDECGAAVIDPARDRVDVARLAPDGRLTALSTGTGADDVIDSLCSGQVAGWRFLVLVPPDDAGYGDVVGVLDGLRGEVPVGCRLRIALASNEDREAYSRECRGIAADEAT